MPNGSHRRHSSSDCPEGFRGSLGDCDARFGLKKRRHSSPIHLGERRLMQVDSHQRGGPARRSRSGLGGLASPVPHSADVGANANLEDHESGVLATVTTHQQQRTVVSWGSPTATQNSACSPSMKPSYSHALSDGRASAWHAAAPCPGLPWAATGRRRRPWCSQRGRGCS